MPAIVSWPGYLPENEVRGQLGTGCDWFPTIAELCEVDLPKRKLDGKSLVAVINSAKAASPHREFHWQMGKQWAVREGDWKLIGNPRDTSNLAPITKNDRLFLANLRDDVGERKNVASMHPEIVEKLRSAHENWQKGLVP